MAHTGTGVAKDVYTMGSAAPKWESPTEHAAGCMSASVPTGVTRTVPTECDIVVVNRFILHGTGALILEGDAQLKVL